MISVEEARARVLAPLRAVGCETVALDAGWRRVLARAVTARLTQPPADVSAMDGYAMRAQDAQAGARLAVIGAAPAGHPTDAVVTAGTAVRLYTGSVVPAGADYVVMQEHVVRHGMTAEGAHIVLTQAGLPGRHIRPAGQDFRSGEAVLAAGRRLSARDIGLAAAAGHPWLSVHRAPRVALLATGDELVLPGEPMRPGGIVSSNTFALAAMIRAGGGEPVLLPIVADDREAIADAARAAAGCDLLVTSGGASVGEHDLVQAALAPLGLTLDFWKIAMRPGKPLMSGQVGGMPMLGLPGNPVSALVCATLFLLPALAVLGGQTDSRPVIEPAELGMAMPANDERADYVRAAVRLNAAGGAVVTPFTTQASSLQRVMAEADALVVRAPGAPAAAAGSTVGIIRLAPLGV